MTTSATGWSTGQRVSLALAFGAMFVVVVLLAGREPSAAAEGPVADDTAPRSSASPPATVAPAPAPTPSAAAEAEPREAAPLPQAVAVDPAEIAELTRQVMPVDETTAEENEQRGDALRRLGSNPAADTAPTLVYALRNDADIRNRILAIDGLRRAALAGNADRTITDALLDASRSDDEVIASQARQALAEIERARSRR